MSNHNPISWEESRLHVFESFKDIKNGLVNIEKTMHEEFKTFKESFVKANQEKLRELTHEVNTLKTNQFELLKKDRENDGKLKGKQAIYAVVGTTVALLASVANLILEFFK